MDTKPEKVAERPHSNWLEGGNRMDAQMDAQMDTMMRAFDWSRTPLGPIKSWPQSLQTTLGSLLQSSLDSLISHVAVLDAEGRLLAVNTAWRRFAEANGYHDLDYGVGSNYLQVCERNGGIEGGHAAEGIRAVLSGQREMFEMDFPCHNTEEQRWFQMRVSRFNMPGPLRLVIAHEDITDRKLAEEKLRKSEERYRAFVEQSSEAIWRVELGEPMPLTLPPDEQIEYFYRHAVLAECNDVMARMYGYERGEQITGISLGDLVPQSDEANIEYLRNFIRSGYRLTEAESHELDRDGKPKYFLNNLIGIIEDGYLLRAWGTQRDITERKLVEESLYKSEQRYRQLADAMPQLVWTADSDGMVDYYNSRVIEYAGIARGEDGAWGWQPVVHPDDLAKTVSAWQEATQSAQTYEIEHRVRMNNGSFRWHLSRALPLRDATGQIVKWFGTATDIHDRKLAEEDVRFLAELGDHIRFAEDAGELMATVAELVGRYLQVSRCCFAEIDEANDRSFVQRDYHSSPFSIAGEHRISGYPAEMVQELREGHVLPSEDIQADPRTAAVYEDVYAPLGVRAHVFVPFLREGKWVSNLVIASDTVRRWEPREISLLEIIAERTWLAVEKLRLDAAVWESESNFRTLAEAMPQMVWVRNADGSELEYINARWLEYTGLSYDESLREASQAVHTEDRQKAAEKWRECFRTERPFEAELRVRGADGTYRWFLARSVPQRDAAGRIVRWFGTSTDIHEQKQSEEDARFLADIGDRIRLAEDAQSLMWEVTQATGEHLQVSNCFFTEVEADRDRLTIHRDFHAGTRSFAGSYARSSFGPELIADLMAGHVVTVCDAAADPRTVAALENFKKARIVALIAVPLLRDERQVSTLIVTMPDVHDWTLREVTLVETVAERTWLAVEKLRLDAQMQRANERFERAEAASRGFVYEWNLLTNQAERTSGLTAMLGYRPDEIPGDTDGWRVLLHPEDAARVAAMDVGSLADGEGYSSEYRVHHKDGHYVWVWDQGRTSFDNQQRPARFIGSVIDISDRKRKEEQIARLLEEEQSARADAERATRLKDEFLGLVSHELRSPLNAINGWIKLLRGGMLTTNETAKALATIERNAQAQNHLIEDLLDVSRVIAGKLKLEPQVIEPHTAIEAAFDTARPTAEAKGVHLELLSAPLGIALNADPDRLQQAVWNLLSNAIKFTPAGGRVTIKLALAASHVEITVSDTGIGIERAFLPYVFERFRQADATSSRKYGGLGLGLAIVRHIVELHGGEVEAASQGDGCGAAFTLKLPLATAMQTTQEPPLSAASTMELPAEIAARLAGLHVLAIDDEEADREMLRVMLRSYDIQVTTAVSAAEGLEMLRAGTFDAVVCDIAMPDGDGYSFIRTVREQEAGRGSRLPAIALTAYARGEDRVRTLGAGFNSHVSKPVEPVELAIVLATMTGQSAK